MFKTALADDKVLAHCENYVTVWINKLIMQFL